MFCKFQWIFLFYLYRFVNYSHKFGTDIESTINYLTKQDYINCSLSLFSVICPSVFCTIYFVGKTILKENSSDLKCILYDITDGLLLPLWQLKRYLDVVYYGFKRIYVCRPPTNSERADLASFERKAEFREFFEDVFAGFLVLCIELYVLIPEIEKLELKLLLNRNIIGSFLSILSLMIAVRRRDDGPLLGLLSYIGWLLVFTSRTIIFSSTASVIGVYLLIPLSIHVLFFTVYVYGIAVDSYRQKRIFISNCKRITILLMVFLFFGLPSLMIWPFLFQLNEKKRPLKFLVILMTENFIWIGILFTGYNIQNSIDNNRLIVIILMVTTLAGTLCLALYYLCKPNLTDQVTRHDDLVANNNHISYRSECSGVYYEFCDLVFILPDPAEIANDLRLVREAYS